MFYGDIAFLSIECDILYKGLSYRKGFTMKNLKSELNIDGTKTVNFSEKVKKALEKLKHPPVNFKQSNTLNMSLVKKQVLKPKELVTKISEVKNTYKKKEYVKEFIQGKTVADYGKDN